MSFGAAVLTFREGLEAALIVAIMLGYLRKVGRMDYQWSVWGGALSAGLMAMLFTVGLQVMGAQFEYPAKGIYEGLTSLLAVGMLTYMIFWMSRQARYIKGSLEHSMKLSLAHGAAWGLFGLAFVTVIREGVETALFLSASAFQTSGFATLVGSIVGLAAAMALAWAIYVAGVHIQLRTFFKVTAVLLVIFAAAILRYAIHEFEEVGWLPPVIEHVWDTGQWIPGGSVPGALLQALVGYTSRPSLLQIIGYSGYLLVVGFLLLRPRPEVRTAPAVSVPAPDSPAPIAPMSQSEAEVVEAGANPQARHHSAQSR
jgi:high-affinity iron transporter